MRDRNEAISSRVHVFTCKYEGNCFSSFPTVCVRRSRRARHEEDSDLMLAQKQHAVSHNTVLQYCLFPRRFVSSPFVLADLPVFETAALV